VVDNCPYLGRFNLSYSCVFVCYEKILKKKIMENLEAKIIMAKELGIKFELVTTNGTRGVNFDTILVNQNWTDIEFQNLLDSKIKQFVGSSYLVLLRKHNLI